MSSGWSLRMKRPPENQQPFIGKFSDNINLSAMKLPVHMFLKDEEIKDDQTEEIKDAEFYKKKRLQRRFKYSKKSVMCLEDSSTNQLNKISFEGRLCDLSLSEDTANGGSNNSSSTNNNDSSFRYALLQVIAGQGQTPTEVHVIPVHSMFTFRKPVLANDKLLDEIDEDYDTKIRIEKMKMEKYRRIGKALEDIEKKPGADASAVVESNNSDGFEIPALFGAVAKKSKSRGQKALLSDSGVDMDVVEEIDNDFAGDYKASFADDEEEHVSAEQLTLTAREDEFMALKDEIDQYDDDDDDDKEAENGEKVKGDSVIAGIDPDEFERSTRAARLAIISDSIEYEAHNNKKRLREEETAIEDNNVVSSAPEPEDKRKKVETSKSYPPTEVGLRAYASDMGGSVSTADLKEAFKSQLKAETKRLGDKKLVQSMFIDCIAKVFKQQDDQGLVLILK
mmetsp:Transcript_9276/g.8291  ORF Transcript_9276/g.8291 Transcript_9276/m.8291 type:complete len:451 (+) Transcript_9276:50-1402(+)